MLALAVAALAAACGEPEPVSEADLCQMYVEYDAFVPVYEPPGAMEDAFEQVSQTLRELASAAPAEVKGDVEYLADIYTTFISDMRIFEFDAFKARFVIADSELLGIRDARERVDVYFVSLCGLSSE